MIVTGMVALLHDLRYSFRTFRKSPTILLIAVLSLGIGIGANTAIFSLIDAVLMRMLPVPAPNQLVYLWRVNIQHNARGLFSYPDYDALQASTQEAASGMFATSVWTIEDRRKALIDGRDAPNLRCQLVTENYFSVMGVPAALGRVFGPAEAGQPFAVVSHRFWRSRLGLDPTVVGRTITLNDATFEIVGVTPSSFFGHEAGVYPDVWVPLSFEPTLVPGRNWLSDPNSVWLLVVARLLPGVSHDQGLERIGAAWRQIDRDPKNPTRIGMTAAGQGGTDLRFRLEKPLKVLFGVVMLVLLIACMNVATLLLASAARRQREFAVRLAIGASRWTLMRQVLADSLLLAIAGGAVGLWLASVSKNAILRLISRGPDPLPLDIGLNVRVLAFTTAVSILTALLFGLIPAWRTSRVDVNSILVKTAARFSPRWSLSQALVAMQVAVCLVLLMCAGLLVQTVRNIKGPQLGYQLNNLYVLRLDADQSAALGVNTLSVGGRLLEGLRSLPWVEAATWSRSGLYQSSTHTLATVESLSGPPLKAALEVDLVAPGYFETMGIPILAGSGFPEQEAEQSPGPALASESFARKYFGNASPIGRRITLFWPSPSPRVIVGVVGDVKYYRPRAGAPDVIFIPYAEVPARSGGGLTFLVRARLPEASILRDLPAFVRSFEPSVSIVDVNSVDRLLNRMISQELLVARLATLFSVLALLLAAVGLYGVISHSVLRRTTEIGIRVALGATRTDILGMVLRQTARVAGLGILIGIPLSRAGGKLLESLLFGVTSGNATTLLVAAAVLALVAMASGYAPARRAASIEPLYALRHE